MGIERDAIRRRWIDALRSGTYKQTRGNLLREVVSPNGENECQVCALGVLFATEKCPVVRVFGEVAFDHPTQLRILQQADVPSAVNVFAAPTPVVSCVRVAIWNDQQRLTFSAIADKLEEAWFGKTDNAS